MLVLNTDLIAPKGAPPHHTLKYGRLLLKHPAYETVYYYKMKYLVAFFVKTRWRKLHALLKSDGIWDAVDLRSWYLAELSPAPVTEDANQVVDGARRT